MDKTGIHRPFQKYTKSVKCTSKSQWQYYRHKLTFSILGYDMWYTWDSFNIADFSKIMIPLIKLIARCTKPNGPLF